MTTAPQPNTNDQQPQPSELCYMFAVPETWPHKNGPLHGLLEFQDGKCGVCVADVRWSAPDRDAQGVAANDLRQWVKDGLLLGLVCYRCARRYKDMGATPVDAAVTGLPAFLADPPAQRFAATVGLGRQVRPRYFDSLLRHIEVPLPGTWSYTNTVTHALFLYQRARCAICSSGLTVATDPQSVHVDHDETTDLIRGLLCRRCNTCLGQDWPDTWWEHHEPMAEAYLKHPPAQICPATRGLTMAERNRPAEISLSADRQEVLLDGMPMSIAATTVATTPTASTQRWYAVRYDVSAPAGLPPILEADRRFTYSDDDGDWLMFVMEPPHGADRQENLCILRVRVADVLDVTQHPTLTDALSGLAA